MGYVTNNRCNKDNQINCNETHFELRCEDCDVRRMSRMTLDTAHSHYRDGRLTQEDFEAYSYAFDTLSPYRVDPVAPEDSSVRRIARKLFTIRSFDVPAVLADAS